MWNIISVILLVAELALLAFFVVGKFCRKKLNETFVFLGLVFLINVALYMVPYVYGLVNGTEDGNLLLDVLERITNAVKLFLGDVKIEHATDFSKEVPVFAWTFIFGAVLAVLATVSAAVEAFSHTIANRFRLSRVLKQPTCDILVEGGASAQRYAEQNENTVLLLGDRVDKNEAVNLMKKGFVVWRRGLSKELLRSRYLNKKTAYHLICFNEKDSCFDNLEKFLSYKRSDDSQKDIKMYLEVPEDKAQTVRREIIEKSGFEECITTFCTNELLARTFAEAHPITEHMPQAMIMEDGSIDPQAQVKVFLLGFGELSRELYRQSVLNDQLVTFRDGEYREFPIHYHIVDPDVQKNRWNIDGLKNAMQALEERKSDYFTLPEMPYVTDVDPREPDLRDTLSDVVQQIRQENTFSICIVDVGDPFRNIDTGARLRSMLSGVDNYHLYVRSATPYTKDDARTTYYGDLRKIDTHDVIVNDALSLMAKKVNEVYQGDKEKAEKKWNEMDYFTLYSNLYSAMNLRLKLHLLGLDYVKESKAEDDNLLSKAYPRQAEYTYDDYFTRSRRNALLAQEHARWNAYHLLNEFLPLEKAAIVVASVSGENVKFDTKDLSAKKHACLTTFGGLHEFHCYLAEQAKQITYTSHDPAKYEVYVYDEMLLTAADELMTQLGYSIVEKN